MLVDFILATWYWFTHVLTYQPTRLVKCVTMIIISVWKLGYMWKRSRSAKCEKLCTLNVKTKVWSVGWLVILPTCVGLVSFVSLAIFFNYYYYYYAKVATVTAWKLPVCMLDLRSKATDKNRIRPIDCDPWQWCPNSYQIFHWGWLLAIFNILVSLSSEHRNTQTDRQTFENTVWITL